MVVELPIGDIHFAKPPKGGGAVGLSPSGNLPDSKGRVTDLMGSLEGAPRFFFLSFLLTSAHSLAAFFLTKPLFLFSRKSREGVGLDGGGFEAGREGWAGADLLAGGLLTGCLLDGGLLAGPMGGGGWIEMGGRDDPKRSTPPTENPGLSRPSPPCGACGSPH